MNVQGGDDDDELLHRAFETTSTPHERFTLMLHERVSKLEDVLAERIARLDELTDMIKTAIEPSIVEYISGRFRISAASTDVLDAKILRDLADHLDEIWASICPDVSVDKIWAVPIGQVGWTDQHVRVCVKLRRSIFFSAITDRTLKAQSIIATIIGNAISGFVPSVKKKGKK
jgi:hypothetical protein